MTALILNELESSQFQSVMDRYREEFHSKLQESNPDLLAFEKQGILALKAVGVVGIDSIIRSEEEFTLVMVEGDLRDRLKSIETPSNRSEEEYQEYIRNNLMDCINNNTDRTDAIKKYIDWHEHQYSEILNDNSIGGHDALFDYIFDKGLYFNEDGEEVPAPSQEV